MTCSAHHRGQRGSAGPRSQHQTCRPTEHGVCIAYSISRRVLCSLRIGGRHNHVHPCVLRVAHGPMLASPHIRGLTASRWVTQTFRSWVSHAVAARSDASKRCMNRVRLCACVSWGGACVRCAHTRVGHPGQPCCAPQHTLLPSASYRGPFLQPHRPSREPECERCGRWGGHPTPADTFLRLPRSAGMGSTLPAL